MSPKQTRTNTKTNATKQAKPMNGPGCSPKTGRTRDIPGLDDGNQTGVIAIVDCVLKIMLAFGEVFYIQVLNLYHSTSLLYPASPKPLPPDSWPLVFGSLLLNASTRVYIYKDNPLSQRCLCTFRLSSEANTSSSSSRVRASEFPPLHFAVSTGVVSKCLGNGVVESQRSFHVL